MSTSKVEIIEKAILRIRDNKEDKVQVFRELGLNYKAKTYYTLKNKYEKHGISGLVSNKDKCGRKAEKGTQKILDFLREEKQRQSNLKSKELQEKIKSTFGVKISVSQINRLMLKIKLNNPVGRPFETKEIELSQAGLFIFLAAVLETNYIGKLIEIQQEILTKTKEANKKKLDNLEIQVGGIKEEKGIFSHGDKSKFKAYSKENKEDYEQNGGVSNKFKSVSERVKNRDLSRLTLFQVQASTLYRKNLTLLCLPIITKHSRFTELNETTGNELKYFCGYDYKANTIDKYAREMKYLQSSNSLMFSQANYWYNFWQAKNNEKVSQICFYFDGNTRPLWSSYRVKQSKVSKLGRVMGCLEDVYIHSQQGHPLMLQTFSGGVYLADAIKKLHVEIDKIMPQTSIRISIFDAGANSVDFYETFKDKEFFICTLDDNQYKQDLSDIAIISRKTIEDKIYIEAEKTLKNSKTGNLYKTRVVLYKCKSKKDRFVAFVSNIPKTNSDSVEIVESYYKRWPNQENQFRDMNNGGDISTNYGFGKMRVINLVVKKNMKYIEEQIKIRTKKIKHFDNELLELEKHREQKIENYEKERKAFKKEIKEIENEIKCTTEKTTIPKLLKELKQIYGKTETHTRELVISKTKSKYKIKSIMSKKKYQNNLISRHQTEYNRIKKKELVYQNDIELNQILGSYKIAFANLSAYILQEYFSGFTLSIEKLINKIFKRPGKLVIKGKKKEIQIYLSKKEKSINDKIIEACQVINSKHIKCNNDHIINLVPIFEKN